MAQQSREELAADKKAKELQETLEKQSIQIKKLGDIALAVGIKNKDAADKLFDMEQAKNKLTLDSSKELSSSLSGLFSQVSSGNALDRLSAKNSLKTLEAIAAGVTDEKDKASIDGQIEELKTMINSDKKIASTITGSVSKILPGLTGVIAGLSSSSPLIGMLVGKGTDLIKESLAKRKIRKEEMQAHALRMGEESKLAKIKTEEEPESLKSPDAERVLSNDIEDNSTSTVIQNNETAIEDDNSSDVVKINDNNILKSLADIEKAIKIPAISQEDMIEAKRAAKGSDQSSTPLQNQDVPKTEGIFSGLFKTLSDFKVMLFSIGSIVGKYMSKFIKFLPNLLKKIPIIGPIISGAMGIFGSISKLSDDATVAEKIGAGVRGLVNGILDFFVGLPIMLIDFIAGSDIGSAVTEGGGYLEVITNAVTSVFDGVVNWFSGIINTIGDFVADYYKNIGRSILSFFGGDEFANGLIDTKDDIKKQRKERDNKLAGEQEEKAALRLEQQAFRKERDRDHSKDKEKSDINKNVRPDTSRTTAKINGTENKGTNSNNVVVSAPVSNISSSVTNKAENISRPSIGNSLRAQVPLGA